MQTATFSPSCVVLHPLSTSNHNGGKKDAAVAALYCILFLHQTTTSDAGNGCENRLYCILFLHQTTTILPAAAVGAPLYCILFLHQTTTESRRGELAARLYCILFLHQTTTMSSIFSPPYRLYCILFLHQTTTREPRWFFLDSCIASSFYIKPQRFSSSTCAASGCIASSFYIKPQPRTPDTLIFGHLTASRHDTKRGGVHRGSRFDAVFTFSTNIRKIIFTEIRRCMSVQRAGARLRSDSSEANI